MTILILVIPALLIVPLTISDHLRNPVAFILPVVAFGLLIAAIVRRTVTLTYDSLVVRNVWRSYRIR